MADSLSSAALSIAQYAYWTRLSELAAATLIIYDYLITFDAALMFQSRTRLSTGKIIFCMIRYYNIVIVVFNTFVIFHHASSREFCLIWTYWQWSVAAFVTLSAEIVLLLRIYAMFGLKRKVLVFLVTALLASWIACIYLLVKFQVIEKDNTVEDSLEKIDAEFTRQIGICLADSTSSRQGLDNGRPGQFFIPILCFEAILCSLAITKAVMARTKLLRSSSNVSTLEFLIRDSVVYFIVVFSVYLFNCLMWFLPSARFVEVPVGFSVALPTIMIQRLLLNLQQSTNARTNLLTSRAVDSVDLDLNFVAASEQTYADATGGLEDLQYNNRGATDGQGGDEPKV